MRRKTPVYNSIGERFDSIAQAAKAYFTSASAIYTAVKTGGKSMGMHWASEGNPIKSRTRKKSKQIYVSRFKQVIDLETGVIYKSAPEAAIATNKAIKTIYQHAGNKRVYQRFAFTEGANGH